MSGGTRDSSIVPVTTDASVTNISTIGTFPIVLAQFIAPCKSQKTCDNRATSATSATSATIDTTDTSVINVISVTTATIATIATSMIIEVLASTLADLDWLRIYLDIDYR